MILYVYDHCPYCVKARMIFGFKEMPFDMVVIPDDDYKTPESMIGEKMTPILEYEKSQYMPESLDIISYIDNKKTPVQVSWDEDENLKEWFEDVGSLHYELAMPRWIQSDLEEFKTESSKEHFKKRLEPKVGSFAQLLSQSPELKEEAEQRLLDLEDILKEGQSYFSKKLSVNDFHLFPILRSFSIVKGLSFPPKVKSYMEQISKESKVPLHFDKAI